VTEQSLVPLVLMRGTSKGLYFHDAHLPAPGPERDRLLLRLMGSPDVLQIDGLGGSRPITSKVAIVAPSARADAEIDYTSAQVDIEHPSALASATSRPVTSVFSVELPGIEPGAKIPLSCEDAEFEHAKRRECTRKYRGLSLGC
jgi:hypothetical protein